MPIVNRRLLVLAAALAGSSALQGCSVSTGQFVPTPVRQPASRYDMLHYRSAPTLHRATIAPGRGQMFKHKYY